MSDELIEDGHLVDFVFLNGPDDIFPDLLGNQANVPIFQDTHEVEAWEQHGGSKDDFIVYNADHTLHSFFEFDGLVFYNSGAPLKTLRCAVLRFSTQGDAIDGQ